MKERKQNRTPKLVFAAFAVTVTLWILSTYLEPSSEKTVAQTTTPFPESTAALSEAPTLTDAALPSNPASVLLADVPHIAQTEDYPTGCESVAAVSLMQYYGVDITVETFIDQYLPKTDYPYYENDVMYGENPWDAFIGDPYSDAGYGCYSTAIVKGMRSALPADRTVHAVYNTSLPELCSTYLDNGHPVLIWATMGMQAPYEGRSWTLPDGETFTFICPEHALVLIGYDTERYYFSDPQAAESVTAYPKADCETAYDALYRQAIVMRPAKG